MPGREAGCQWLLTLRNWCCGWLLAGGSIVVISLSGARVVLAVAARCGPGIPGPYDELPGYRAELLTGERQNP